MLRGLALLAGAPDERGAQDHRQCSPLSPRSGAVEGGRQAPRKD